MRIEDVPSLATSRVMYRPWVQMTIVGLVLAACHFLMTFADPFSADDQGLQYLLSRSWARGESLFARWDLLYIPGQYSYFGSLMRVLGEDLWVHRLGGSVLVGASAAILFRSVRHEAGVVLGVAVAMIPLLAAKPQGPTLLAMALVAGAALRIARPTPIGGRVVFTLAVISGLMFGWREDSAVLSTVVALAASIRWQRSVLSLGLVVVGFGVGFAGWLFVMTIHGESVTAFVRHVLHRVVFLVERLFAPTLSVLDAPGLGSDRSLRSIGSAATPLLVATPLLFYLWLLAGEAARWWRRIVVRREVAVSAVVGLCYWPQFGWERPDVFHFVTHLPVFVLSMVCVAATWAPASRQRFAWLLVITAAATVTVRAAETRLHTTVPYPTPAALQIGARLRVPGDSPPPWANLPRSHGDTMIVLGFAPGLYVLEDYPAGTMLLSTHARVLADPDKTAKLKVELQRPSVRWVIAPDDPLAPTDWLTQDVGTFLLRHFEPANPESANGLWKRRQVPPGESFD